MSKYIAIVDDELDIVDLFEALEMKDIVLVFLLTTLALNHILKDSSRYSLIISDFRMPQMNGNELVNYYTVKNYYKSSINDEYLF